MTLKFGILPSASSSGENRELLTDVQDLEQSQSDFRYEATMVRISALGWSSDLRNLPETNFFQLYDYPVVSRKYRHTCLEERIAGSSMWYPYWITMLS